MMDLLPAELTAEYNKALAEQAHQQWLAAIDARIKAFSEHARRSEAQRCRWWMERHRERIQSDLNRHNFRIAFGLYGLSILGWTPKLADLYDSALATDGRFDRAATRATSDPAPFINTHGDMAA